MQGVRAAAVTTGLAVAGIGAVSSFRPSLLDRAPSTQAAITGVTSVAGFAAGAGLDALITKASPGAWQGAPGKQLALRAGIVAAAVGTGYLLNHASNPDSSVDSKLRTAAIIGGGVAAGGVVARTATDFAVPALAARIPGGRGIASAVVAGGLVMAGGVAALAVSRAAQDADSGRSAASRKDLLFAGGGIAAAGAATGLGVAGYSKIVKHLDRLLPGDRRIAGIAVATAAIAGLAYGVNTVKNKMVGAAAQQPTDPSKVAPAASHFGVNERTLDEDTFIPRHTLEHQGIRMVDGAVKGLTHEPVRVYAGLNSAASAEERADLAVKELERQGGLERDVVIVASPTGSGIVDHIMLETAERLGDGDVASVTVQYNRLASFLSLPLVDQAADAHEQLLTKLRAAIDEKYPNGDGPKVMVYGESLGAWTSIRATDNGTDLDKHGVERAVWMGTPSNLAQWSPDDSEGLARQIYNEDLDSLADDGTTRILSFAYANDPIHRIAAKDFVMRPNWIDDQRDQPSGSPLTWTPVASGMQTVGDMVALMGSGYRAEWGNNAHDYRAAMGKVISVGFDLPATDGELARIAAETRQSELATMDVREENGT